jgi:hypothetical protein
MRHESCTPTVRNRNAAEVTPLLDASHCTAIYMLAVVFLAWALEVTVPQISRPRNGGSNGGTRDVGACSCNSRQLLHQSSRPDYRSLYVLLEMTRGHVLKYKIAFALRRASKIIRGLKQRMSETERYAVAEHVVSHLQEHGDPWRLSD